MIRFRSVEPGRPEVMLVFDARQILSIAGDPDVVAGILVSVAAGALIAAALRTMKTYARGSGGSPTKWECELEDGWIGIHATDHAVSIHLGRDRGELVLNYVRLSPYDAGVLAKHLEGDRPTASWNSCSPVGTSK